jgi:5-methylcytosine-specific restriction protein B
VSDLVLDDRLTHELRSVARDLDAQGRLPARSQLTQYYDTFRARFGPERLRALDGNELLVTMHDHAQRDVSLVYWLEFKDDEEFPSRFGSIAGGSALKFGIYRRKETGVWMAGSPADQRELALDEAVQIARRHRDQLLRGAELINQLPAGASDAGYLRLQEQLFAAAPDVADSAWGHKYWSLLFPGKLEDIHNPFYQRFHLVKLLQLPPAEEGRYASAGRFVALTRALDWPMNTLTTVLNRRNGSPHGYWRVGTTDATNDYWGEMRAQGCVAIGWPDLGDLSSIPASREGKDQVRALLEEHYPNHAAQTTKASQQVFNFVHAAQEGDLVLAAQGMTVLGVGRITGEYTYDANFGFPHRRNVQWLAQEEFRLDEPNEGLRTTFWPLRKPQNHVAIERHLLKAPAPPVTPPLINPGPKPGNHPTPPLAGIPGRLQAMLERKGQVILYGPPGTGKTHLAEQTVRELAAHAAFGVPFKSLSAEQQQQLVQGTKAHGPMVRMCSFHPAYGYEEFLEGYRPQPEGARMQFALRDGIFKQLCEDARGNPQLRFYLLIDEINRGDVPRILGELLTVLEKSKRGKSILLPMSGAAFSVPENVFLVGTMNTADRSIALLDTALRRRFAFLELMPDYSLLGTATAGAIPLGPWLQALNRRICEHVGRDGRNLQVGHAYLLERETPIRDFHRFARVVQEELIPLLEEYCYEDWAALERILGKGLVDAQERRVRHERFAPGEEATLTQALLALDTQMLATAPAVAADANRSETLSQEEDEENPGNEAA